MVNTLSIQFSKNSDEDVGTSGRVNIGEVQTKPNPCNSASLSKRKSQMLRKESLPIDEVP